jgi:hypothetical protein
MTTTANDDGDPDGQFRLLASSFMNVANWNAIPGPLPPIIPPSRSSATDTGSRSTVNPATLGGAGSSIRATGG